MDDLGPSPHPFCWLTYQVVVPGVAVEGVGATDEPVPPTEVVYHNKPLKGEAVKATAV